ncbi:MAG: sensor histidine kinase [Chloroflexota bacterium]
MTPLVVGLATANTLVALAFFAIGGLIVTGLIRERRLGFNALGTATAFVFLSCAAGHGLHAQHYLASFDLYLHIPDLGPQLLVDGFTVAAGFAYLAQRRRHGLVIRGPHALLDFARRLEMAEALREIGQDIAGQTDLDKLLLRLARHAHDLLNADYAAVVTVDAAGATRRQVVGIHDSGWDDDAWQAAVFLSDMTGARGVLSSREPVLIEDFRALPPSACDRCVIHKAEGARTLLAVPIPRGERVIGSLMVGYRSVHRLGEREVASMAALASQATVAVENARLITSLREADRLKAEFLSAAAHELKSPITSIAGWTQILLTRDALGPKERRGLEVILRQAHRMTQLSDDLIMAVNLQPSEPTLAAEWFDLGALVERLVQEQREMTERHTFRVLASGPLHVKADERLVGEVIRRLLENALRYSPAGGAIEVEVRRTDAEAVVAVRDQGIGIPPERQQHVFEPFYEAVPSGQPGYQSTVSLGLYVGKRVVEAHRGRIWVKSESGSGSTFFFTLPLAPYVQ